MVPVVQWAVSWARTRRSHDGHAYPKLRTSRVPWSGRDEDKDDDGIWAVTCLVVRKGYRGSGRRSCGGRAVDAACGMCNVPSEPKYKSPAKREPPPCMGR